MYLHPRRRRRRRTWCRRAAARAARGWRTGGRAGAARLEHGGADGGAHDALRRERGAELPQEPAAPGARARAVPVRRGGRGVPGLREQRVPRRALPAGGCGGGVRAAVRAEHERALPVRARAGVRAAADGDAAGAAARGVLDQQRQRGKRPRAAPRARAHQAPRRAVRGRRVPRPREHHDRREPLQVRARVGRAAVRPFAAPSTCACPLLPPRRAAGC